ncbi:hypothetical protein BV22DRAFT_1075873 [Leucogyrophana mollusca]|uniref:Uncharacterized protein n=1 Tax=Leucogyrophana mollusca TaxID=85980 RepID=A0ACB8B0E1_9AGAM|nr:hypothetical protein BV22DRAFT_1075873 [Leucogyrophana mollusca]
MPISKIWKGSEQKLSDTVLQDARSTDIVIPVMGPTGVGKSTFINTAAGGDLTEVGHSLKSCTAALTRVIVPYPYDRSRRIVFVDTPGFDDTYEDDTEILRRISVWLARSYSDKVKLAGIIYLHEITQPRMKGTARRNFDVFDKLCGVKAAQNVILGTTKRANVKPDVAAGREQQLRDFWKDMIQQGSLMAQFDGTSESAWKIVNAITDKQLLECLHIQNELVDLGKILPETAAGSILRGSLKDLVAAHKKTITELRGGKEGGDDVQARLKDTEDQIRTLLVQIQALKVPIGRRILAFFGLGHLWFPSNRDSGTLSMKVSEQWPGDTVLQGARATDIVIPVIGTTGVGKSTVSTSSVDDLPLWEVKPLVISDAVTDCIRISDSDTESAVT